MLILNGFEIKTRLEGTPQQYYTAKRGEEVFTSKDFNYIKQKVSSRGSDCPSHSYGYEPESEVVRGDNQNEDNY